LSLFVTFDLYKMFIVMILLHLQGTIGDIASIADKKVVQNLFKKKMSDLLKCTQNANKVDDSESSMQIDTPNDVSQSVLRC
jgi:hypothetical protein